MNLWSGSNKTCNSSSRARHRPERMQPVLHQYSFIQGVRGFRVLEIWIPERSSIALIHPVYLSLYRTAICSRSKTNNCCVWKMHSFSNNLSHDLWYTTYLCTFICWRTRCREISNFFYCCNMGLILHSVSWKQVSPVETNLMLTALTGQQRFSFTLHSHHYTSVFIWDSSELVWKLSSTETSEASPTLTYRVVRF